MKTSAMLSLGRISYMNVAPVYYGFDRGLKQSWFDIVSAPPSTLNAMLANGELDISPVSCVAYAKNQKDWLVLPGLSISCFGRVMSVNLASKYSFQALENKPIILTKESETAATLLKLIFAMKGITPIFERADVKSPKDLDNYAAALVIGDTALKRDWQKFKYVWDLGEIWKDLTGLPFVFAIWAVRKSFAKKNPQLVSEMLNLFRASKNEGRNQIKKIALLASEKLGLPIESCTNYYNQLCYELSPLQIKGLEIFFEGLYQQKLISKRVRLSFFDEGFEYAAKAA